MEELALHILDIVENAMHAAATRIMIQVIEEIKEDTMRICITDNGKGMDTDCLKQALDPFFTTKKDRKTGLGLPLFAQAAEEADGKIEIYSTPGKGTSVSAVFKLGHMDRKPLGNMEELVHILKSSHPGIEFIYEHSVSE